MDCAVASWTERGPNSENSVRRAGAASPLRPIHAGLVLDATAKVSQQPADDIPSVGASELDVALFVNPDNALVSHARLTQVFDIDFVFADQFGQRLSAHLHKLHTIASPYTVDQPPDVGSINLPETAAQENRDLLINPRRDAQAEIDDSSSFRAIHFSVPLSDGVVQSNHLVHVKLLCARLGPEA